jgi:hypothetical protein
MQQQVVRNELVPIQLKPESGTKGVWTQLGNVCLESIAIVFWVYVIFKLFVCDIDTIFVDTYFPYAAWLIDYKFFICLGLAALTMLVLGKKYSFLGLVYVVIYPFYLILWKLPKVLIQRRMFTILFAVANSAASLIRSFRYNFVMCALWLISCAVILRSDEPLILALCATILLTLLVITYFKRFILIFRPTTLSMYRTFFSSLCNHITTSQKLDDEIRDLKLTDLNQEQRNVWTSNLQMYVMVNRISLIFVKILRKYQNSGITQASGAITTIVIFIITSITFALINCAI